MINNAMAACRGKAFKFRPSFSMLEKIQIEVNAKVWEYKPLNFLFHSAFIKHS